MQEIPESVQKTVDAISAELRLLPNLEEVTGGMSVLLPNATNRLVGKFVRKDGGPGRDRTDDLFHAMEVRNLPAIDSKGTYDRRNGLRPG